MRELKRRKRLIWYLTSMISMMVIVGVNGINTKCTGYEELQTKKYINYKNHTNIKLLLDSSPRVTHQMLNHVFKIVLEELHGYANIDIITRNDEFNIKNVIGRYLNSNDIPSSMINLETWIPSWYDLTYDLIPMYFLDGGALRNPGFFGWFVPKDMLKPLETYKTNEIEDVSYNEFRNESFASLFDIDDETLLKHLRNSTIKMHDKSCTDNSQCINGMYVPKRCELNRCAWLLAPDYESTSFVIEQINELNLYVKVAWLGNDLNRFVKTTKSLYFNKSIDRSLLILSWYPSDIITNATDFLKITFKLCTYALDENRAKSGCEYEIRRIVKLSWVQLPRIAPPIYQMLLRTTLSDQDYKTMLDLYNDNPNDSYDALACKWIKTSDTWMNWTTRIIHDEIYIGGIFPYTPNKMNPIAIAANMAIDAINNNKTILPYYKVKLISQNGNCSVDTVLTSFIDYIKWSHFNHLVGVLGPACTETVEPLAAVSKRYNNLIVSYSAEGADYSDRNKYPYVFRTISENIQYKYVYLALFKQLDWHRVAAFTKDGQKYTEYITHLDTLLSQNNITFIANSKFPEDRDQNLIPRYLEDLKNKRAKIIIADTFDHDARIIMCSAYKLGMTAKQGYVWFLPHWLEYNWYNTDDINEHHVNCTTKEMFEAINGYFILTNAYFATNDTIMQENKTVKEWRDSYSVSKTSLSNYGGYVYDAVWTYAFALDKILRERPEVYNDFHTPDATKLLVHHINQTDFQGVSGEIKFRGGASRYSVIDIMQFYNGTINTIGNYYPNLTNGKREISNGKLLLNESNIVWLTENGQKPDDGTLPSSCALEGFANFLNVECYEAVIYLNIIIFSLLCIIVLIALFIMKKRYEKREELIEYMKSIGIDLVKGCKFSDLDKWEVPRECIILNRKIGEGAFGKVYGGEANIGGKGWVAVAVKSLKVGSSNEEQLDFLSEAEIMKRFNHKNIIELLGVCTKNEPVLVIMEFMLYGDLKTFLLARRHLVNSKHVEVSEEISSKKLTSMALDVARGLSYLAEMKYVHRDLASRNCLINANRVVKIGDFGMTRPMFDNDYYKFHRKGKLPVRWMAPESLALGIFTPGSDVWSYGVLLYEIITFGSFPFQGMSNSEVLDYVKAGNTLTTPQGVKPQLEAILKSCWNKDKDVRPKASEIVEFIANNPRLISPCLDVPLSSIQIDDTAQMDIISDTSPQLSKCASDSFNFINNTNRLDLEFPNIIDDTLNTNCIQMELRNNDDQLITLRMPNDVRDVNGDTWNSGVSYEEQKLLESKPNGHAMTTMF